MAKKKSPAKKTATRKAPSKKTKKWVRTVDTESTFPEKDLFKQDAKTIARRMASKKVSPKGIGSGIKMVQYFINRAGKDLSATRKKTLERAKHLLQEKLEDEKSAPTKRRKKTARKTAPRGAKKSR